MNTYKLAAGALLASLAFLLQMSNGILGLPTGFGMTIDLVGVPVLVAFFILGYETALYVAVLVALAITLFSPTSYIGAFTKFAATMPMVLVPAAYLLAAGKGKGRIMGVVVLAAVALIVFFGMGAYFAGIFESVFGKNSVLVGIAPLVLIALFSYLMLLLWKRYAADADAAPLAKPAPAISVLLLALLVRGVVMIAANFYFAGPVFFKMSPEQFVSFMEGVPFPFLGTGVAWYALIFFWNVLQGAVEFFIAWMIAFKFGFFKKYAE